jgi:hypothetical protein
VPIEQKSPHVASRGGSRHRARQGLHGDFGLPVCDGNRHALFFYESPGRQVEIKPSVGDDYPAVLRQMKAYPIDHKILFLVSYTGTTEQQFIDTFKSAGIAVVFRPR